MGDPMIWVAAAIAVLAAAIAFVALKRSQAGTLEGRLAQMAESQLLAQAQFSDRLQAQERALTLAIETRLAQFGQRMGESLQQSANATHDNLADLKSRLALIDAAQRTIAELSGQVTGLQELLGNKQARGAFGEVQLMDLVRTVLPASSYRFQAAVGGRRVDCLIVLPHPPGPIAVDAKFPLESYRALREARDDAAAAQARRDFTTAIRGHVRDIAQKYIVPGETADSALLFLPSEAVYAELHASFPNLVEEAFRARVWIVSPTTLMATLTTMRAVLRDVHMREQADLIQREVALLLEDVARLDERAGKLQKHFEQAGDDVRALRISTEKVIRRGERIDTLQLESVASPQPQAVISDMVKLAD